MTERQNSGLVRMAETTEKTAGGATRTLFGSLGLIFITASVEGMTGQSPLQIGTSLLLFVAGVFCGYAAFFWESAKNVLSTDAQKAIGNFAQHKVVRFGMLALVLEMLVLSPFIEQRRWPFSYPADPKVIQQNNDLTNELNRMKGTLGAEKELADKWRVTHALRSQPACNYELHIGSKAVSVVYFWNELFRSGGWTREHPYQFSTDDLMPTGIFMRVGNENGAGAKCAAFAQSLFSEYYPNPPTKVIANQQSPYLSTCGDRCVQIEINY